MAKLVKTKGKDGKISYNLRQMAKLVIFQDRWQNLVITQNKWQN